MADNKINVGGRLHSIATGNVLAGADEILDDNKDKKQSEINIDVDDALANRYTKDETYNKNELNSLITTPDVRYVTVTATEQTTAATDVLPATGVANTVYRVGNWDGSEYMTTIYSEYAWSGSAYVLLDVKEYGIDDVPTAGSGNLVKSGGVAHANSELKLLIGKYVPYTVVFILNKRCDSAGGISNMNGWATTELTPIEFINARIVFGDNNLGFSINICRVFDNAGVFLGSANPQGEERYLDCTKISNTYPTAKYLRFNLSKSNYTTPLVESQIEDWSFSQYDRNSIQSQIEQVRTDSQIYTDEKFNDVGEQIEEIENIIDKESAIDSLVLNSYFNLTTGVFVNSDGWVRTDYIPLPDVESIIKFDLNNSLEFIISNVGVYSESSYLGNASSLIQNKKSINTKSIIETFPAATKIVLNLHKSGYTTIVTNEDVTDFSLIISDTNSIINRIEKAESDAINASKTYTDEKSVVTLNEAKVYTDEKINGVKNNALNLNLNDDSLSYIRTSFDEEKWLDFCFYVNRNISMNNNPSLNFAFLRFTNKTGGTQTTIHTCSDDITPSRFNNSYTGANHGDSDIRIIPCTNHGKTYSDIGSIWSCNNHQYTIVGIKDSDNIYMLGENRYEYPIYRFYTPPVSNNTFIHVSGATHTEDIVSTGVPVSTQYYPAYIIKNKKIMIDGEEITESGSYNFTKLVIVENYDIFNPASVLEVLHQAVGTLTSNPTMEILDSADKVVRHSIIYTFESASELRINTNFIAYQDIEFDYFGFTQQGILEGDNVKLYIPKALPVSVEGNNLDLRTIINMSSVTETINLTSEYWENPLLPPDRWLSIGDYIALHSGYLFDYGVGGSHRKDYVNNALQVYKNSKKIYPHGADSKIAVSAGDVLSAVVWRSYKNLNEINTDGIVSKNCFEYNNTYYIYLDFNQSGMYNLNIPTDYINKKIEVFEKSGNVTLLAELSNTDTLIKVDTASSMYGYLVAKISK